jgi:uncharacterized membrane protein
MNGLFSPSDLGVSASPWLNFVLITDPLQSAPMHMALTILFRWMHVFTAAIAVGGAFFIRLIVPTGLAKLDPDVRREVSLKLRRIFKMVVHTSILLLLVSGLYNTIGNWHIYNQIPQTAQPLWGVHILLALIIFSIAIYVLMGKEPPRGHGNWMALNLLLMLLTFGVAAGLKYVRDNRPILTGTETQLPPTH